MSLDHGSLQSAERCELLAHPPAELNGSSPSSAAVSRAASAGRWNMGSLSIQTGSNQDIQCARVEQVSLASPLPQIPLARCASGGNDQPVSECCLARAAAGHIMIASSPSVATRAAISARI